MNINRLMKNSGPSIYYDDSFRVVLETFVPSLIVSQDTTQISVSEQAAYKYESDFFGLLSEFNIPVHLHWLVMRMNNLTSPFDSTLLYNLLLVPDENTIDHIRQSYMSGNRING